MNTFRLLFIPLLFTSLSQAAVWPVTRQWSPGAEQEYRQWVHEKWNQNFFSDSPSKAYKGLVLDCADAVYSMRAIFAREHGYEFVIRDPSKSSELISSQMSRFDDIADPDLRVRAFLQYLYKTISTRSVPNDTYPVAMNREAVNSGTMILTDATNHHSWTIWRVSKQGVTELLFASRPARSKLFYRKGFPSTGFMFPRGNRADTHAGFRNFRQPQDLLKPVFQVPGYSTDQYEVSLQKWHASMQKGISIQNESATERLQRLVEDACMGAKERVVFVNDGLSYRRKINGRCMNATEFDDNSTPGRDSRLRDNFIEVVEAYKAGGIDRSSLPSAVFETARAIAEQNSNGGGYCPVEIGQGRSLELAEISKRLFQGRLSTNPNDPHEYRWGYEGRGLGPQGNACPKF